MANVSGLWNAKSPSGSQPLSSALSARTWIANRQPAPAELADELDALQGVKRYPARVKCALLPWTTLRESIDLYRHREPAHDGLDGLVENCADSP